MHPVAGARKIQTAPIRTAMRERESQGLGCQESVGFTRQDARNTAHRAPITDSRFAACFRVQRASGRTNRGSAPPLHVLKSAGSSGQYATSAHPKPPPLLLHGPTGASLPESITGAPGHWPARSRAITHVGNVLRL